MEMKEEYYAKHLTSSWYDPRIKQTIEVYAITYEMSKKPDREKILTLELLKDYSDAGDFDYDDELKIGVEEGLPVYPVIEIGTVNRGDISDNL
jgi:hypothetical protein